MDKGLKKFIQDSNIQVVRQGDPAPNNIDYDNIVSQSNMGNFAQFVNTPSPSPSPSPVKIGKLNVNMYNILVNKDLDSSRKVDLLTLVSKVPLKPTRVENNLVIDVREINGLYGRFQKGITVTRNRGIQGEFSDKYFTVQFKVTVSKDNVKKDVSFNVYDNGKIRFSGGFVGKDDSKFREPEIIRKHIIDNYTLGQRFLYNPLEYNNLSGDFKTNANIDLAKAARILNASYEPEITDLLYYSANGVKYIFTRTGNVKIQGVTRIDKLVAGYEAGKQIMNTLFAKGAIRSFSNVNIPNRVVVQQKTKKSSCPVKRQPVNGKCPNPKQSVRKNPQGFDCCYVKKTKSPQAKKKKSPTVRLVLDPKGGLKIGTKQCMRYSKSELVNIAKNQGIINISKSSRKEDICAKLVNTLGIVQYAPFRHNGSNYVMNGRGNQMRIGRRICTSYSLSTLRAFATKMNIPYTAKDTRKKLCEKIENVRVRLPSPNKSPSPKQKTKKRTLKK